MAFCPHCGKQVTEQATKCIACGTELDPKAKTARFKGTMMMTPAAGAVVASPAGAAGTTAKAPEPQKPAAPAPVAAAPAPKAPTPGPSKVMKATMLGTGGAGLAPPMAKPRAVTSPNAPAQVAPPPAARAVTSPNAPVQVAPPVAASPVTAPTPTARAQQTPAADEPEIEKPRAPSSTDVPFADERTDPEDSQRFLVGDPMAPAQAAARVTGRGGRESGQDEVPLRRTGQLLAIGLAGLLVIAVVGYLAARFMGLVN